MARRASNAAQKKIRDLNLVDSLGGGKSTVGDINNFLAQSRSILDEDDALRGRLQEQLKINSASLNERGSNKAGGIGTRIRAGEEALDLSRQLELRPGGLDVAIEQNRSKLQRKANVRGAKVAASRKSQRDTSAINKLISSGRKRVRSASSALPRTAGLATGENKRSLLL